MPLLGLTIGFVAGMIFCRPIHVNRTLAYETALQNTGLGMTMIAIAYPNGDEGSKYVQVPLVYTFFQIAWGLCLSIGHRIYFRVKRRTQDEYELGESPQTEESKDAKDGSKQLQYDNTAMEICDGGTKVEKVKNGLNHR